MSASVEVDCTTETDPRVLKKTECGKHDKSFLNADRKIGKKVRRIKAESRSMEKFGANRMIY